MPFDQTAAAVPALFVIGAGLLLLALLAAGLIFLIVSLSRRSSNRSADTPPPEDPGKKGSSFFDWPVGIGLSAFLLIRGVSGPLGWMELAILLVVIVAVVSIVKQSFGKTFVFTVGCLIGLPLLASYWYVSARHVVVDAKQAQLEAEIALLGVQEDIAEGIVDIGEDLSEALEDVGGDIAEVGGDLKQLAKPRIDLSEETNRPEEDAPEEGDSVESPDEPKNSEEEATEAKAPEPPAAPALASKGELPAWVSNPPKPGQMVITTDPFPTVRGARGQLVNQLVSFLSQILETELPGSGALAAQAFTPSNAYDVLVTEEHVEERDSSVGEVFVIHTLVESNEQTKAWALAVAEQVMQQQQRSTGLIAVTAGGGTLLASLAVLYGVLSLGGKPDA